MKVILTIIFMIAASVAALAQRTIEGTVTQIVDGRTVVIETNAKQKLTVKLQFIEVPEPEQELSATVKDHLQKLTFNKTAQFVTRQMSLETSQMTGRLTVGGVDVSQQMLRDGAAWYALPEKDSQNANERAEYQKIEATAKTEKRGVWGNANLKPAWEFRADKTPPQSNAATEDKKYHYSKTGSREFTQNMTAADAPIAANIDDGFDDEPSFTPKAAAKPENLDENLSDEVKTKALKVINLSLDVARDFGDSFKQTGKVYDYKYLVEGTDAIEEAIGSLGMKFDKAENRKLLSLNLAVVDDLRKAMKLFNKADKLPYKDAAIAELADKYQTKPVRGVNGENVIIRQTILSNMMNRMQINFNKLKANILQG